MLAIFYKFIYFIDWSSTLLNSSCWFALWNTRRLISCLSWLLHSWPCSSSYCWFARWLPFNLPSLPSLNLHILMLQPMYRFSCSTCSNIASYLPFDSQSFLALHHLRSSQDSPHFHWHQHSFTDQTFAFHWLCSICRSTPSSSCTIES